VLEDELVLTFNFCWKAQAELKNTWYD